MSANLKTSITNSFPKSSPIPPQPPHFNNYYTENIENNHYSLIRIPNISHYTQEIIDGSLILIPKQEFIKENELKIIQITNTSTVECVVKNKETCLETINKNAKDIILDIWKSTESRMKLNVH